MSIDTLVNDAGKDIAARLEKLKTDIKAIPPVVTPPPPPTNVTFSDNFDTDYELTSDGSTSPNGLWRAAYLGFGKAFVKDGVMNLLPKEDGTHHAALLLSTRKFKNFTLSLNVKNVRQLIAGSAAWRSSWIFFRYADNLHHYYIIPKSGGGNEFGKKDNLPTDATVEKQITLPTIANVDIPFGQSASLKITVQDNKTEIWVNGKQVVNYTDTQIHDPTKMAEGAVGIYSESCHVQYDNVNVTTL